MVRSRRDKIAWTLWSRPSQEKMSMSPLRLGAVRWFGRFKLWLDIYLGVFWKLAPRSSFLTIPMIQCLSLVVSTASCSWFHFFALGASLTIFVHTSYTHTYIYIYKYIWYTCTYIYIYIQMHMYLYMYKKNAMLKTWVNCPSSDGPVGSRRSSAVSASEAASRGRWPPPLGCAWRRRRSTRRCLVALPGVPMGMSWVPSGYVKIAIENGHL